MNQFFPDIKSLANFLIAQNSQTETKTEKDTGQVGFGDLLGLQMLINQNAQNAALNNQTSDNQAVGEFNGVISDNGAIRSNWQFELASFVNPLIANTQPQPLESLSVQGMLAGQLKDLAIDQQTPITLQLNKIEPGLLPDISAMQPQVESPLDVMPGLEMANKPVIQPVIKDFSPELLSIINPVGVEEALSESTATGSDQPALSAKQINLNTQVKISFTADNLLLENKQYVPVKAIDANSVATDYLVPIKDMRTLVESYGEEISIQIAANPKGSQAVLPENRRLPNNTFISQPVKLNEQYIVDFKSLLAANEMDKISVLLKQTFEMPANLANNIFKQPIGINNIEELASTNSKTAQTVTPSAVAPEKVITPDLGGIAPVLAADQTRTIQKPSPKNNEEGKGISTKTETIANNGNESILTEKAIKPVNADISVSSDQIVKPQGEIKLVNSQMPRENIDVVPETLTKTAEHVDYHKIISQLKANLAAVTGNTQMTIRLKPESLGNIKVNLKYNGSSVEASFQVENPEVKRVLDAELPRLRDEWKIDNIRVETGMRDAKENPTPFSDRQQNPKPNNERNSRFAADDIPASIESIASSSEPKMTIMGPYNRKINIMA